MIFFLIFFKIIIKTKINEIKFSCKIKHGCEFPASSVCKKNIMEQSIIFLKKIIKNVDEAENSVTCLISHFNDEWKVLP